MMLYNESYVVKLTAKIETIGWIICTSVCVGYFIGMSGHSECGKIDDAF